MIADDECVTAIGEITLKDEDGKAVMERFFSSLEQQRTHHERFADLDEARRKVFDCIEVFYNGQRLHRCLGYRTPVEYDQQASGESTCPRHRG